MTTEESGYDLVFFSIDRQNIIRQIGDGWDAAAQTGSAPELLDRNNVLGQAIESCISDDNTRMYYEAVFKLCRLRNEPLTRDYRCDSPTHQRYMRVTLYPQGDGSILMKHETLREVPFSHPVVIRDMSRSMTGGAQPTASSVWRCSMCNRLKLKGSEAWISPETLSEHETKTFHVIHTVCPDCRSTIWSPLKKR